LSARRPKLDPYFHDRLNRFLAEVDEVSAQYAPVFKPEAPRDVLVVSPDWARLLARFNLRESRPCDAGLSALTPTQLRQIVDAARQKRVTSMFVHADTPPAVIADLQNRTDLTVLTLDALGSSARTGRSTYAEILKYNLDQLHQGASPRDR
jgi:ABC-type Zn uptake system ZnuABC Zn-binding protein ZnuA